ncbi:alpha-mannosidase [Actinophytocola algeriensis]|uniref:Alpha-mannosidase n=1 Tax=Actinophytocola algeriensis TaxID=1768010 RepID=A0A7W7Q9Z1_9PSEU|nr:alpha-mannosidase [Actinophytocola algeriensis]MBB4909770.1 alpha-mannosidase [Actinophytocola algeriensis]MBE1475760.1 alpha-mannosidase [Actinophytocola algeriensis]
MTARELHMIGNAHIDPVWLWQWPEGYQEVRATFQSAIDRMEEYPEFVFTCDSVLYLAWVEEHDPDLFARIGKRIADGRWQQVGGWWIEPDCNLPGGESFVRQALYSQRYLKSRFGVTSTVGCNVDPFGHNAALPQILAKSGMDAYVFMRPGPHEMALPGPYFWWESADGTRVLTYRIPHEYCSSGTDLGYQIDKSLAQLPPDVPDLMVFYGVGNHGGGPTKANLDSIRRLDATGGLPRLRCSSPREFFDRLVASGVDIPVHAGELQHHAVGCYSAHSGVKRWNRRAENLLARAEKWASVAAALSDVEYPLADLTSAWKLVLFNQFHDTLGGAAIEPAYEDSRDQYGHAVSLAGEAFNRSVQTLARRIDIQQEPDMTPLVVFNPHPWRLVADIDFEFGGFAAFGARAVDDEGNPVAVQRTRSKATVNGWRRRLTLAADVPPLGYRVYRIHPAGDTEGAPAITATDTRLENEFVALEIDPSTGWLSSLRDKVSDVDVAGGGAHGVVIDDRSDTWGHRVRAYDKVAGTFAPRSVRLVEHGPVRAVVRVVSEYGSSTLTEEYVLGVRDRHVEVRVTLDWHEKQKLLKLRFPTALSSAEATFEIPYGHLVRPANGSEEAAQAWVDVSGELPGGRRAGLAVLNDGKYGHDVLGGDIGVTAARSPVYAWHEPKELDPEELYTFQDQGRQEFTCRLVPHGGDWRAASVVRLAAELNQPAFPLLESYHDGDLPAVRSFMAVSDGSVVPTVLKAAEDGDALVVRAYETAGRACDATIEVLGRTVTASFGPAEIKTFLVPHDVDAPVVETDMIEW